MVRFYPITNGQLVAASVLIGIIASIGSMAYAEYKHYSTLPVVEQAESGECIRVINFENGHAFNCNDVDIVLRQYRSLPSN